MKAEGDVDVPLTDLCRWPSHSVSDGLAKCCQDGIICKLIIVFGIYHALRQTVACKLNPVVSMTSNTKVVKPSKEHRQQCRSRRANPNERVNDITSPAGHDLLLALL